MLNGSRVVLLSILTVAMIGCRTSLPAPPVASTPNATNATSDSLSEIEIQPVTDGVWVHTSHYTYPNGTRFPSNGLIVQSGDGLLLVDTAWGELQTAMLLDQIETSIHLPVRWAVITHAHHDRSAGTDLLEARGVEVVAHPRTQAATIAQGTAVPDTVLEALETVGSHVSWQGVEIVYPGPAHAPDNLMVWIPEAKVVFGGCAVRAAATSTLGSTADADIAAWPDAIRRARDRYPDAAIVVPGHGAVGDATLFDHTLEILDARATSD